MNPEFSFIDALGNMLEESIKIEQEEKDKPDPMYLISYLKFKENID